jgi:hypothetical protein
MNLTWQIIDNAASDLGATDAARAKWRQRRVPAQWQVKIARHLMQSGMAVALADFDQFEKVSQ